VVQAGRLERADSPDSLGLSASHDSDDVIDDVTAPPDSDDVMAAPVSAATTPRRRRQMQQQQQQMRAEEDAWLIPHTNRKSAIPDEPELALGGTSSHAEANGPKQIFTMATKLQLRLDFVVVVRVNARVVTRVWVSVHQ